MDVVKSANSTDAAYSTKDEEHSTGGDDADDEDDREDGRGP